MKLSTSGGVTMKQVVPSIVLLMALMLPVVAIAGDTKLFNALDTDKNGSISKDELLKGDLAVVKGPKGKLKVVHRDMLKDGSAAAMTEEQKKRLFDQLDTDKNGQISRKEWSRASRDGFILLKF